MSLADDIRADIGQDHPDVNKQPVSLADQMRADISPDSPKASKPEGMTGAFLHSAASLADTIRSIPSGILQGGDYAVRRAFQETPEEATQDAKSDFGRSDNMFGRAFGIMNTPGYQNEVTHRVSRAIGGVVNNGVNAVSNATGLPPQDVANMAGSLSMLVPGAASKVGGVLSDIKNVAGEAAQQTAADDLMQAGATHHVTPQEGIGDISQYAPAGASSAGLMARLHVASPELQTDAHAAFAEAQAKYGQDWSKHVDWNAIDRQLNADSLPVPGRLTRGQATKDGALISEEWNKRNVNGLGETFAAQNENQVANLKTIREQSTPDVYTNTPAEHADTLINAYKDLHAVEDGAVDAKWDAIRKQSNDGIIFDAGSLLKDAQAALKNERLTAYDPGGQMAILTDDARRGGLTADGFSKLRKRLGAVAMRGGEDGAAAGAVLDAISKSELTPEAGKYRDAVNDALASGRALHQKLASDPAYKAVVEGNASVKDFTNKFIVNGKPENIGQMSNNLAGNDVARQTMRASLLDSLRNSAALDEQYQGNFAAKGFNKQLSHITPGARAVFDDGELQTLRSLGDYSTHISAEGRGSWKNHSNTATELNTPTNAMGKKVGGMAVTAAEMHLAHHTGGASIPIISALRAGSAQRAAIKAAMEEQEQAAQYIHDATRPAAGFVK